MTEDRQPLGARVRDDYAEQWAMHVASARGPEIRMFSRRAANHRRVVRLWTPPIG